MAYIDDPYKKNEEQNQTQQPTGGNIYATSSGDMSSNEGGNNYTSSQNQNQNQNGSGWVNLDLYLDANKGKTGRYAQSLVQDQLNTQDQYKTGLSNAVNNYGNTIKQDTAYNTGSNASLDLINKGAKNLSNLSDEETQTLGNTLKGYQGIGQIGTTGNDYGLYDLRNQSEGYNKFAEGLLDESYQKSLMDPTLSSGAKTLNSFLLGSQEARDVFDQNSNAFRDLANLYGSSINDADNIYNDVVSQAEFNKQEANKNFDKSYAQLEKYLDNQYKNQVNTANKEKGKVGSLSGQSKNMNTNNFGSTLNLSVAGQYGWDPSTANADQLLQTEKDELKDRIDYLRTLGDSTIKANVPTSQLDDQFGINFLKTNYNTGSRAVSDVSDVLANIRFNLPDEIKKEGYSMLSTDPQAYARRTFNEIIDKDPEVKRLAQKYVDDYIRGKKPDKNQLRKDIRNRIVLNYSPSWDEAVLAPIDRLLSGDIKGSIEKFNDVATAPVKWGYNAGKKTVKEVGKGLKSAGKKIKKWFS